VRVGIGLPDVERQIVPDVDDLTGVAGLLAEHQETVDHDARPGVDRLAAADPLPQLSQDLAESIRAPGDLEVPGTVEAVDLTEQTDQLPQES
jgi:hypothetical protein